MKGKTVFKANVKCFGCRKKLASEGAKWIKMASGVMQPFCRGCASMWKD